MGKRSWAWGEVSDPEPALVCCATLYSTLPEPLSWARTLWGPGGGNEAQGRGGMLGRRSDRGPFRILTVAGRESPLLSHMHQPFGVGRTPLPSGPHAHHLPVLE